MTENAAKKIDELQSSTENEKERKAREKAENKAKADIKARKFAVIEFNKRQSKLDPEKISVGVNGYKYRMKRGEKIPVPSAVIHALRNAQEPVVEEEENGAQDNINIKRRKVTNMVPRFPFTLHGWISEVDYEKLKEISMERSITEEELDKVLFKEG